MLAAECYKTLATLLASVFLSLGGQNAKKKAASNLLTASSMDPIKTA
ncbi:UDP-N-acetylglucosamine acyltransferase [Blastopirellula marina DSM 3645]|uniref:UDP-N-acetylglucosamine acyltransferase n=1 Tax=Blastopirellula marina DSM 3645 TaxID=314230 RepID=A3ZYE8_9BACT|nr:UDP-N-acetylglucosamine acyltransferase [Blastopirellula marina DSM 3645]